MQSFSTRSGNVNPYKTYIYIAYNMLKEVSMVTAHIGRSVMLSALLSVVLFFHVACVENKEEEKPMPAPQAPSVKPVPPAENDSARKPTQDSVKKPVRM